MYAVLEVDADQEPRLIPDENGKVRLALVYLIKWVPNDHYNFGYKDMSEFCGPNEEGCPLKLLDMLSPVKPEVLAEALAKREAALKVKPDEFYYDPLLSAHQWRERCRKTAEASRDLKVGQTYKLPHPLKFSDGGEADTLKLIKRKGGRSTFLRPDGYWVRVSRGFDFSGWQAVHV
jgi:hypothetical protein